MDKEDKFCLKWNDYSSNLEHSFKELRNDKLLFDMTLSCGDTQIEAHRVVLSACSNFFKDIIRKNPHSHPLLYLRGVKVTHLISLMDFMYNGEVNMSQSDLSEFLAMAGDLQVKGLTPTESNKSEDELGAAPPLPEPLLAGQVSPPCKKKKLHNSLSVRSDLIPSQVSQVGANNKVKKEKDVDYEESSEDAEALYSDQMMEDGDLSSMAVDDDLKFDSSSVPDAYDEHNAKVDLVVRSKMVESPDGWACSECGFSGTIRKVYQHVEMSHVSVQYYCQICQKVCKTRNSLFCHRYRYHRNKTQLLPEDNQSQTKSNQSFSPPNKTIVNSSNSHISSSIVINSGLTAPPSSYIIGKLESK